MSGFHWPVDSERYHADRSSISFSGLKDVLKDPAVYFYKRLSGKPPGDDDTEALEFGRKMHDAIFRPGEFGADVVTIPVDVLSKSGSRAGGAYREFVAAHPGKVLLKDGEPMHQMLLALGRHDFARDLLSANGQCEYSVVWHDDEFGVDRRCRFDKVLPGRKLIVDYKTTEKSASPEECVRVTCDKRYRYHAQMEFYRDGAEEFYGERFEFVFIFQSKSPPYRVEAIHLDEKFSRIGKAEVRRGLRIYADCLKSGVWLPETHGQLIDVSPPAYLEHSEEWELANG